MMKHPRRWPSITIFVVLQVAWVSVVTLWIIWYVKYHFALLERIGAWDIVIIVEGSILLLLILIGIVILFVLYQRQLTLMRTQIHLISSITHEFKTPLATTQLYLETLMKRDLPQDTRQQLIAGMLGENQRLKALVDNYLETSRLSHRRKPYNPATLDLADFFSGFMQRHDSLVQDLELVTDIAPGLQITADKQALDLVFSNLTENAIHYATAAPHVEVRARADGKWVFIEFRDTGIGIPRERSKDVFKMFQRLPEGIALWGTGTGMGLYVVREIVKAHGGRIRVNPTTEEAGTAFLIRLPRTLR